MSNVVYQSVERTPKGAVFARYCRVLGRNEGRYTEAAKEVEISKLYKDTPQVLHALKSFFDPSAVPFETSAIARDFFALYREKSVVGQLKDRFFPMLFFKQNLIEPQTPPEPVWTTDGVFAPVTNYHPTDVYYARSHKNGLIIVLRDELLNLDGSDVDKIVSANLIGQCAAAIDATFLGDSEPSELSPGGIFFNAPTVTSSGTDVDSVRDDLSAMCNMLRSWKDVAWFMQPKTFSKLCSMGFVDFGASKSHLLGREVIQSTSCPAQIGLVDVGSVLLADEGKTAFDYGRSANVTYKTLNEDGEEISGVLKLYQEGYVAFKVTRYVSWHRPHTESAVSMAVEY